MKSAFNILIETTFFLNGKFVNLFFIYITLNFLLHFVPLLLAVQLFLAISTFLLEMAFGENKQTTLTQTGTLG